MPKVVRTMAKQDEMPAVGTDSHMLGARVPIDIAPDSEGRVHPASGGISVARSLRDLLPHLVPKRLRQHSPDANGSNNRFVWGFGEGEFAEGSLADRLCLSKKPDNGLGKVQGLVEPDAVMPLEEYQTVLAATKPDWFIDEPK